jgi:hypothetical protein
VVLGDLIADLVASLLTIALQLLPVLHASRTVVGQILGTRARRTGGDASRTGHTCRDAGSGSSRGTRA